MSLCVECDREFLEGEAFCPFDGTRLPDRSRTTANLRTDPLVGKLIDGRYRLEGVIGRGGMGTVYRGMMEAIQRPVAVKVLRSVNDGGEALARFEREARSASKLGEPHIVDIFDFGKTPEGLAYLVMEHLVGEDVGDLLARRRCIPLDEALSIVEQCCQGLGAAHEAGIVHRDLKPENIFLVTRANTRPMVKLVDFGLAKMSDTEFGGGAGRKLTKTGMIFGTPQYMSPEQCLGKSTDPRSDIYALGAILFELLTGHVPFEGETFMGVLNQHICDAPPSLSRVNPNVQIPHGVEATIYRCLAKNPEDRPQSMDQMSAMLVDGLRGSMWSGLAAELTGNEPVSFSGLTGKNESKSSLRRTLRSSPPSSLANAAPGYSSPPPSQLSAPSDVPGRVPSATDPLPLWRPPSGVSVPPGKFGSTFTGTGPSSGHATAVSLMPPEYESNAPDHALDQTLLATSGRPSILPPSADPRSVVPAAPRTSAVPVQSSIPPKPASPAPASGQTNRGQGSDPERPSLAWSAGETGVQLVSERPSEMVRRSKNLAPRIIEPPPPPSGDSGLKMVVMGLGLLVLGGVLGYLALMVAGS